MENSEAMEVDKKPRAARFSKNKKRNWAKLDITETQEFLEKKRLDEIQFGGALADQKDEDLFFLDKSGTEQPPKKVEKGLLSTRNRYRIFQLIPNHIAL